MAINKNTPSTNKGGKQIKGPGEGPIFTIANYVVWLFLSNLYFLLLNIPLLYVILTTATSGQGSVTAEIGIPLMLASLPTGPAAAALFSVMGKLIREKDLNVTRDFFKAYKVNFMQSLFLWTLGLLGLMLLSFDVNAAVASNLPRFVIIGVYVLMVYLTGLMIYVLAIVSRFHLKLKDILQYAVFYSIRKPHVTVGNLFCFGLVAILSVKNLSFMMMFLFSIIALAIMSNLRGTLAEIQERLTADPF